MLAGQRVHDHLGHRRAVGEVEEGMPAHRGAVPMDVGRLVEAGGRKAHTLQEAELRELAEIEPAIGTGAFRPGFVVGEDHRVRRDAEALRRDLRHPAADRHRRIVRRPAIEVRARGGRRRRGVRHFCGRGRGDRDTVEIDAEDLRHDLGDLHEKPLPHLRAAMVQADGAVGIDMHQRAGLVQVLDAEGDAEGQHHRTEAPPQRGVGCVEGRDLRAASIPIGIGTRFSPAARYQVALHALAIGQLIRIAVAAEEIARAHVLWRQAAFGGDAVDHILHQQRALRAAKTAEGGVGDGVGLHRLRRQRQRRHVAAIHGMGDGAEHHAARHVEAPAPIGGQQRLQPRDAAGGVEAGGPAIEEGMALAGRDHVRAPRQAQLHGPARRARGQRGGRGDPARVALLAAEAATHAAAGDGDRVVGAAQHAGDDMLPLRRVLGRGHHGDVPGLAGRRQRHLAFQVEMLLPAGAEFSREAARRGGDGGGGIATPDHLRRDDILAEFQRALDAQHGLERRDLRLHRRCRAQRLVARGGDDEGQRHAGEFHQRIGKQRLTLRGRRDVVLARDVARAEDRDDARHGTRGLGVQRRQPPMWDGGEHQRRMQRAGDIGDVVGVARLAGRVLQRAVMAQRGAGALAGQGIRAVHHTRSTKSWTSCGRSGRVARRCSRCSSPCATASR